MVTVASIILVGLKVGDVVARKQTLTEAFIVASVSAEEETPEEDNEDGDKADETGEETAAQLKTAEENNFTQTELDILQRLSKRREKLEEWQKDLEVKENILNITQTKIDQKLDQLKTLKEQVEALLQEYNKKEDAKTMTLVKVYENMKPKAAAQIFAELDMETLLQVVDKMKEKKVADILAQMEPKLAKELTETFAARGKLAEISTNQ